MVTGWPLEEHDYKTFNQKCREKGNIFRPDTK
jgi:hypothetical protein